MDAEKLLSKVKDEFGDLIRGTVTRSIPAADRDDVESVIYISIWTALQSYRGKCSLKSYIYPIVKRRIADYFRGHYKRLKVIKELSAGMEDKHEKEYRERELDVYSLLTPSELLVFKCVAMGLENGEIAEALHITVYTVRSHMKKIYKKAGIKSERNLVLLAHRFWREHEGYTGHSPSFAYEGFPDGQLGSN